MTPAGSVVPTLGVLAFSCVGALAQSTTAVSVTPGGSLGNAGSTKPAMSADGRFVAFASHATDLVAGDTNAASDVFVRDRVAGTTTRVSVATGGAQGDAESFTPGAISADGRYVAFTSRATNLVAGDTNAASDVFVHDRLTGITTRESVSSGGVQGDALSDFPVLSADARHIAFRSNASNLVAGDTNGMTDTFVRDRLSGVTTRISVSTAGAEGDNFGDRPSISADGRFVAFQSWASNLVPGDTNGTADVFLRDRLLGTTSLVSVNLSGVPGGGTWCEISADGTRVLFTSGAPDLVPGDTNGQFDVFVRDLAAATTTRVSVATGGAQASGSSGDFGNSISADGRFAAFDSTAPDLVAADTNNATDQFVRDLAAGVTTRISLSTSGTQANNLSRSPSISADGRCVAFESLASNLVLPDLNGASDVFVREIGGSSVDLFCFGDGSGTACPCGNSSTPGLDTGCRNSLGLEGRLRAGGISSLGADSFVLSGSQMPDSSALYFQGTDRVAGGAGVAFGDGLRCAGGSIVRLGTRLNAGGASSFPGAGQQPVSVQGMIAAPGTRTYQVWYRNAAAFCTPSTFNLTNALEATWTP